MGLQILLYQVGVATRHSFLGLWRARSLVEPTNNAVRSMLVGMLGIDNEQSVSEKLMGYIRVPIDYISENVIARITQGVSALLPSAPSIPVSSMLSSAATGVAGVASTAASGVAGAASTAAEYLPSVDSLKFWRGTGGALLKDTPSTLIYNNKYQNISDSYDINMFNNELNNISFLTKSQQNDFNNSKVGKNLNKLKKELDKALSSQLDVIVKQSELRVSMNVVIMEKFLNLIESNIPKFKKGFKNCMNTTKLLIKHDIKLIDSSLLFPELLNENFINPVLPQKLLMNINSRPFKKLKKYSASLRSRMA
jgi:hypothetical protein